jgi:hypothetical protein
MRYTLSLFDRNGRLLVKEPFGATDHIEAEETAWIIIEACKDIAEAFEVRYDQLLLTRGRPKRGSYNLPSVIHARRNNVLDLLNRLQTGFTQIALSRRLLRITTKLRRRGLL